MTSSIILFNADVNVYQRLLFQMAMLKMTNRDLFVWLMFFDSFCFVSPCIFYIRLIVGLITNNDESEYNEQISEVVLWCKAHNLLLNAAKTKELIFDFRHSNKKGLPLSIDNSIVEICDNFKYLGITFDCKLKWSNHCTLIVSKCKQRLFFLRLLNSFGVKNDILHVFYTSMIESIICYNILKFVVVINEREWQKSSKQNN